MKIVTWYIMLMWTESFVNIRGRCLWCSVSKLFMVVNDFVPQIEKTLMMYCTAPSVE